MNLNELKTKFDISKKRTSSNIEDLAFQISIMITEARVKTGLTQAQLAKKMGTKQPSIARVENGGVLPSLEFLQKMAKALNTQLAPPVFDFLKTDELRTENINNHNNSDVGEYIIYVPFKIKQTEQQAIQPDRNSTTVTEFSETALAKIR